MNEIHWSQVTTRQLEMLVCVATFAESITTMEVYVMFVNKRSIMCVHCMVVFLFLKTKHPHRLCSTVVSCNINVIEITSLKMGIPFTILRVQLYKFNMHNFVS